MKSPPPKPGLQFALASPRWRSDASSIFANACETTSCVDSVPITDAMLTAAGSIALLSVPGSDTISTIERSAPIAHGRSWQRNVRMTPMIAPSIAGRAQLIGPGACGDVPREVEDEALAGLRDPAAHPVDLVVGPVVVVVDLPEPAAVGDLAQARAHDPLDVLEDALLGREERVEPVLGDQLADALVGGSQGRDARAHVQRVELRGAAVAQVGAQHVGPRGEAPHHLDAREQRRLAEAIVRAR